MDYCFFKAAKNIYLSSTYLQKKRYEPIATSIKITLYECK